MRIAVPHVALLRDALRRGARPAQLLEPSERSGLHPLVVPLYTTSTASGGARVVGLLARAQRGAEWLAVETSRAQDWTANALAPLGTVRSLLHRIVAEAHAADPLAAAPLVELAARADGSGSPPLFDRADPVLQKLGLHKYLLMRAGTFPDVWAALIEVHLARADVTAALIAAERCTELNRGWGCALWAQSRLAARVGRAEEARDLALAALLEPLDTLGAPVRDARAAAAVPDGVSVVAQRARLSEQRQPTAGGRAQPPQPPKAPPAQGAAQRAADMLDDAVEAGEGWASFDARALAAEYERAGRASLAAVARGEVEALD